MQREEIDVLLNNPYLENIAHFSVAALLLVIFLAVFEWVTSYRAWDEIAGGNGSVSMAVGGKIFGICNIFRYAIADGENLYGSFVWAALGFLLLLLTYFIFEFLTPVFRVDEELARDNRAVGWISMTLSVALSFVIGAAIAAMNG